MLPEDGNVFEIGEDVLVWTELTSDGDTQLAVPSESWLS